MICNGWLVRSLYGEDVGLVAAYKTISYRRKWLFFFCWVFLISAFPPMETLLLHVQVVYILICMYSFISVIFPFTWVGKDMSIQVHFLVHRLAFSYSLCQPGSCLRQGSGSSDKIDWPVCSDSDLRSWAWAYPFPSFSPHCVLLLAGGNTACNRRSSTVLKRCWYTYIYMSQGILIRVVTGWRQECMQCNELASRLRIHEPKRSTWKEQFFSKNIWICRELYIMSGVSGLPDCNICVHA